MTVRTLARYATELVAGDDRWNLRLLLHEFGLVWEDAPAAERAALIAEAPAPTGDLRWDAFLAAYGEHLAYHAGLPASPWMADPTRHLEVVWFPLAAELSTLRHEAIVTAPASFEAHGILLARRELQVV